MEKAPDVPKIAHDLLVLQSLRKLIRAADIFSRRLIKEHKVSGPQLMCLHKLVENEGMTVSELSKEIFLSPSTVVGILDRLEKQQFVTRERSVEDRRKVILHVTQSGKYLVEEAPSPLHTALQNGLGQLSLEEQAIIAENMQKLVDILEIDKLDAAPILDTGNNMLENSDPPIEI